MKPKLTEQDFIRAAKRLRCEVNAVKAVAQVESAGAGFYSDGFPVILFERHIFRRETGGKYSTTHPSLSGSQGNYGPAGRNQRLKFSKAFALDPDAAMKACSWGKFQILGVNHKICGFSEVGDFVEAMKESEGRQLDAFVSFVAGNKLDKYLREKNWAAFAKGYNGPGYAKNKYDIKMRDAYAKFEREAPTTSAAQPTVDPVEPAKDKEGLSESPQPPIPTTQIAENIVNTAPQLPPAQNVVIEKRKEEKWLETKWKQIVGLFTAGGVLDGITDRAQALQAFGLSSDFWKRLLYVAAAGAAVWLITDWWKHRSKIAEEKKRDEILARENSQPGNFVQFADTEYLQEYRNKGYKVITR